jgi:hypothetical protein
VHFAFDLFSGASRIFALRLLGHDFLLVGDLPMPVGPATLSMSIS